jgi:hypothetical protein
MVSAWVLGNVDAGSFVLNTALPQDYEIGTVFGVVAPARLTGIRWWRASTDPDYKPTHLRVLDLYGFTIVHEQDPIPDDGEIGWQVAAIDGGPLLAIHNMYTVSAAWETNRAEALYALGDATPSDFPAAIWSPARSYTDGGVIGFPSHRDNANLTGADAQVTSEDASPGYEVVAETDYSETLKWAQPADKYRLTMTIITSWNYAVLVEATDVRRIAGFWQPMYADSLGKRYQIDSPTFDMIPPDGKRMDGLLLDTSLGSAGHVQALLLVP